MSGAKFRSEIRPFQVGISDTDSYELKIRALEEENKLLKEKLGRFVRTEVTPEEETAIRKVFELFDTDGSGSIDVAELRALFKKLGEPISETEAQSLIAAAQPAQKGRLTFPEFLAFWKQEMSSPGRYGRRFKVSKTPIHPLVGLQRSPFSTQETGDKGTLEYRVHLLYEATPVSFWHDVPLYASDSPDGPVNYVCEIPKWTRAKYEIATGEEGNPIKQDHKNTVLRYYKWGDMMFNYGAFPQTWEDPEHITPGTGHKGDNDPLDVVEIGVRQHRTGSVVAVKPLGVLALIDDGETDWKVIAIDVTDVLAPLLNDISDVERHMPGAVEAIREFFRVYKVAEGKPLNAFGFDGQVRDAAFARDIIRETHGFWQKLHERAQRTVPK